MTSYPFSENPGSGSLPPADSFSLSGKRAVIVEDEGMTQMMLGRILRSHGVSVVGRASNGLAGTEVVLRECPDFVLMDVQMPVMDGLEASRRILAAYQVCIVVLTAFSEDDCRQCAAALGTGGYVVKPVTAETLLPALEAAYHGFQGPLKPHQS